MRKIEKFLN